MAEAGSPPVFGAVNEGLRTTTVCLSVGYGARHDPVGAGGLAHILEHALMAEPAADGTPFAKRVGRLGGNANAETGLDCMLFYAQVDAADADHVSRALVEAVTASALTEQTLRSERQAALRELAAAEADDSDVVQDRFLSRLFPGHPLGRPVAGTIAEIEALTLADIREGYQGTFLNSPMALMVVGPRIPEALSGAPRLTAPPRLPAPTALPAVDARPPAWADEFGWLCVGGRSPGQESPSLAYEVLAHLLGGSPSSLLYGRLREEEGLAYMFQAWNRGYREAGAWRVMAGAEPENLDPIVDIITQCLEQTAAGVVEPEDIQAARVQARMQLVLDMESPLEYARLLGQRWCGGQDPSPLAELSAFEAVTDEAVARAAAGILENLVVVTAPEKA